jgi:Mitochondrial carrier protein
MPQDIIKTKQQTYLGSQPLKAKEALNQLLREGGIFRLYKGGSATLLTGYISNMITLPMYDLITCWLRGLR